MFDLIIILWLILCGYVFWSVAEKKHYKRIQEEEKEYRDIIILSKHDLKELKWEGSELITGNIVLSIDLFKKIIAWFVQFFWGTLWGYETLLDRARRDSVLQLKKQAKEQGCNAIANLKLETSSISKGKKWAIGSVEVLAYASAVKVVNEL